jgi:hypothetical protein
MAYTVQQMPRVYGEVMSKYPNEKMYGYDVRLFYYHWLNDRANYGLKNAIAQFLGGDITEVPRGEGAWDRIWNFVQTLNGTDAYLSKSFSHWDLVKFIYGYGGANYVGWDTNRYDNLYLPIAMRAFGIPHSNRGIEYEHYIDAPARYVRGLEDIVFGLPDAVLQPIKAGQYNETLIFPGNGISCIGSPLYGIRKDIAYGQQNPVEPNAKYIEAYLPIRGNKIYFFKLGQKG